MTIRNGRGLELSEDDCVQQNTEILLRRPGGWWAERFRLLHVARHLFSCNHWSLGRWTSCLIYIYITLHYFISCNRWVNESLAWNPWYYLFSSPILMPNNPPCLGRGLDQRFDRCHGYRPLHSDSSLGASLSTWRWREKLGNPIPWGCRNWDRIDVWDTMAYVNKFMQYGFGVRNRSEIGDWLIHTVDHLRYW